METIAEVIDQLVTKHMRRILILLFTIFIGMIIAMHAPAHAQTRSPLKAASPSPKTQATAPVPLTVGAVADISDTSVTLTPDSASTAENSQPKTFTLAQTTRIEAPGITKLKRPTVKNIAAGDTIAVASLDQTAATLIVIAAKGAMPQIRSKAFLGIVSSREATSAGTILSLKHPKNDTFAKALVSSTTTITARGIEKPTVDDIKASDRVLVSGIEDQKAIIGAKRLFLIPGKARGLLDRITSPQASPVKTATPAATKVSPSPKSPTAKPQTTP